MWTHRNEYSKCIRYMRERDVNSQRDETATVGRTKKLLPVVEYRKDYHLRWLRFCTVHDTNNRLLATQTSTYFAVQTSLELASPMCSCRCRVNEIFYSWIVKQNGFSVFSFLIFFFLLNTIVNAHAIRSKGGVFRLQALKLKSPLSLLVWAVFWFWILNCVCVYRLCAQTYRFCITVCISNWLNWSHLWWIFFYK